MTKAARTTKKPTGSTNKESATSRNLTRTLLVMLFLSMSAWAVLASLIAWHSHNRYKYSRVDLQDQRDIYTEFKQESKQQYEFLRRNQGCRNFVNRPVNNPAGGYQRKQAEKLHDLLDRSQNSRPYPRIPRSTGHCLYGASYAFTRTSGRSKKESTTRQTSTATSECCRFHQPPMPLLQKAT